MNQWSPEYSSGHGEVAKTHRARVERTFRWVKQTTKKSLLTDPELVLAGRKGGPGKPQGVRGWAPFVSSGKPERGVPFDTDQSEWWSQWSAPSQSGKALPAGDTAGNQEPSQSQREEGVKGGSQRAHHG